MNQTLPLPNPQDWVDTTGACRILGRSRATLHDMADRGVLRKYLIGAVPLYWAAEVREVAAALRRLEVRSNG